MIFYKVPQVEKPLETRSPDEVRVGPLFCLDGPEGNSVESYCLEKPEEG